MVVKIGENNVGCEKVSSDGIQSRGRRESGYHAVWTLGSGKASLCGQGHLTHFRGKETDPQGRIVTFLMPCRAGLEAAQKPQSPSFRSDIFLQQAEAELSSWPWVGPMFLWPPSPLVMSETAFFYLFWVLSLLPGLILLTNELQDLTEVRTQSQLGQLNDSRVGYPCQYLPLHEKQSPLGGPSPHGYMSTEQGVNSIPHPLPPRAFVQCTTFTTIHGSLMAFLMQFCISHTI